jgi:hypothetical protein
LLPSEKHNSPMDSHLTLNVGVCLRADCPQNELPNPFPVHNHREELYEPKTTSNARRVWMR